MSGSASRYTSEQRCAILDLILEQGVTVREAVAAARAGLPGIAPFDMPVSTAGLLAAAERRRRARAELAKQELDAPGATERFMHRAVDLAEVEMAALEAKQEAGQHLDGSDLSRMRQVTKTLREVQRLSRSIPRSAPSADETPQGPPKPSPLIQRMEGDLKRNGATA